MYSNMSYKPFIFIWVARHDTVGSGDQNLVILFETNSKFPESGLAGGNFDGALVCYIFAAINHPMPAVDTSRQQHSLVWFIFVT